MTPAYAILQRVLVHFQRSRCESAGHETDTLLGLDHTALKSYSLRMDRPWDV